MGPLRRRLVHGVIAGTAGTVAMDLVWFARFRRGGGKQGFIAWETADGLAGWEDAPAPGQVGKQLATAVLHRDLPDALARPVTNLVHWATGIGWGVQYGLLPRRARRRTLVSGPVYGSVVWSSSYALLPRAGIYKPIWRYDVKTLTKDLSAHLVYGTTTAATFWALELLTRGEQRTFRFDELGAPAG